MIIKNNEKKIIDDGNNNNNIRDRTKQKVSLSRYRSASYKVMNIFQRFIKDGDILLRASIDEAYMDLTSTCTKMMQENNTLSNPFHLRISILSAANEYKIY